MLECEISFEREKKLVELGIKKPAELGINPIGLKLHVETPSD